MDSSYDRHAPPATSAEADLRQAMDRSDREVAARLTVPAADVLAELDLVSLRMEARRPARRAGRFPAPQPYPRGWSGQDGCG